jgi:hypothetical protein
MMGPETPHLKWLDCLRTNNQEVDKAGDLVQWKSACLEGRTSWVLSPTHQKKNKQVHALVLL